MQTHSSWQDVLTQSQDGHHMVQVYHDEAFLTEAVGYFIGEGLLRGEAVVVAATAQHTDAFTQYLATQGFDVEKVMQRHQLCFIDAHAALKSLMKQGEPDWHTFHDIAGGQIREAHLSYPKVRAWGEMVDILWQKGEREAAMTLENFWNKLAQRQDFSLMCSYFLDPLSIEAYDGSLERICNCHSHLIPADDYAMFDAAVSDAGQKILGPSLTQMLRNVSKPRHHSTAMPAAQAALIYLNQHMPLTAKKFLAHVRRHYDRRKNGGGAAEAI